MFTGIVEAVGTVLSAGRGSLTLAIPDAWRDDPVALGESVAVNGCCLTAVPSSDALAFDLSPETLARTTLSALREGSLVNLERAVRVGGRMGGHFVQGHVDAVGNTIHRRTVKNSEVFRFSAPDTRYLADKGSVAVDGVSLTVVRPEEDQFDVWVVPHTLAVTTLGGLSPGQPVNLEYDIVARYLERLVRSGPRL